MTKKIISLIAALFIASSFAFAENKADNSTTSITPKLLNEMLYGKTYKDKRSPITLENLLNRANRSESGEYVLTGDNGDNGQVNLTIDMKNETLNYSAIGEKQTFKLAEKRVYDPQYTIRGSDFAVITQKGKKKNINFEGKFMTIYEYNKMKPEKRFPIPSLVREVLFSLFVIDDDGFYSTQLRRYIKFTLVDKSPDGVATNLVIGEFGVQKGEGNDNTIDENSWKTLDKTEFYLYPKTDEKKVNNSLQKKANRLSKPDLKVIF